MRTRPAFQMIVLTPSGLTDPSLAIAASRAGETGVLDLEYARDGEAVRAAMERLARHGRGRRGAKFNGRVTDLYGRVPAGLPEPLSLVILTYSDPDQLRHQLEGLRREGRSILLECTSLAEARVGETLGFDGLIAKGTEAGGRVGEETTFILLQRFLANLSLPVWAQGGVGLHTAAACYASGAAGIVLDSQLYLTRESPLPEPVRSKIAAMDGSETLMVGQEAGECYRVYARPGAPAGTHIREEEKKISRSCGPGAESLTAWREAVVRCLGWTEDHLWPLGQDAAFAAPLARRFGRVAGALVGIREAIRSHWEAARALRPLDEGAPLAVSLGTRYPIVQGPMTRVSDTAAFAEAVADGGALPFLALALMRGPEVRGLLEETNRRLEGRPWGVGILGFVPLELRDEQLQAIRAVRPPLALIAGGRPDQARALDRDGIPTFLHVPSPGLLRLFLADGAQRFVFEGRECGGHVGPRSSFVLWESMIDVLLEHVPADPESAQAYHVLFAGGIHDALSASMVAVMAAPLAERGVRIGVLMGTAYLFTAEAVASGAIVRGFQEEGIRCDRTVLLETGPGHATRCAETPYVEAFLKERRRLAGEGKSAEEIRLALEELNLGRLRIASKGTARRSRIDETRRAPLTTLSEEEQRAQGMYMIGQVAALRRGVTTMADLHHDVAAGSSRRLEIRPEWPPGIEGTEEPSCAGKAATPSDVAIIGMACILPKAPNLQAYWHNILNKVNAVTEVPADRWDWRRYYDPDPKAKDKVYSKWGGFIDDMVFNPMVYGIPPSSLSSIEPLHLLTLEAVRAALKDANYLDRPFDRERVSVILGAGGAGDLAQLYGFRSGIPQFLGDSDSDILAHLDAFLPQWTEDSFPGILTNVAAGRVANRFDLGGVNYTVDAACASSLAAVQLAVKELEGRTSDMVIVGGADTMQSPFAYLCFSKTLALSPSGRCRTFDEKADGIAISEGIGVLVLKRLADAERDGDRIYAVIKGVGGASDGRDKGLTAPRPEGQIRALRRAYAKAGISPATVGLIEAHGTGTVVGDRTELDALNQVLEEAKTAPQSCAVGSVKSMIGHTKNTAGVASLIKVALALHHKVLPPTINVERPNPRARIPGAPFYVNTEPRPWIHGIPEPPRRAGVSAFGFGGTNFHAVVEEYTGDYLAHPAKTPLQQRSCELLIWRTDSRQELVARIASLRNALSEGAQPPLPDLAFTLMKTNRPGESHEMALAVVAASLEDLRTKLDLAHDWLMGSSGIRITDPRGIYFSERPLAQEGRVAFLFPGQGSQYTNMLRDLAINFPEVREEFELADRILVGKFPQALSAYIFPPPSFDREEEQRRQEALTQTNIAQPAMGAADLAMFHLLERLGVRPAFMAGHSYGEYVGLCAAGVFREEDLFSLSEARGRFMVEAAGEHPGTMAVVDAGAEVIRPALAGMAGVVVANLNAPQQTVIAGARSAVDHAIERFRGEGLQARRIPVACAFHSPIVASAQEKLAGFLSSVEMRPPRVEVFSNTTAAPHSREPSAIAAQLVEHVVRPVRFAEEIEALYAAGVRLFVEVGPRNVLSGLTDQILGDRPHAAIASDQPGRASTIQLLHALGRLVAEGVSVQLDRLFEGTPVSLLDLNDLPRHAGRARPAEGVWLVNGGWARPAVQDSRPHLVTRGGLPERLTLPGNQAAVPGNDPAHASGAPPSAAPAMLPELRPTTPAPPSPSPERVSSTRDLAVPSRTEEVAQVVSRFQQLMQQFLETQRSVMLAYLRGQPDGARPDFGAAPVVPAPSSSVPSRQETLDPPAVSTKSVSPPVAQESPPAEAEASLGASLVLSEGELTIRLIQLVSQRTGYPSEMLDLDLDLEADLGIDSIKRVEILGNFQRLYARMSSAVSEADMEKLTTVRTLRGIIGWIVTFSRSVGPGMPQDTSEAEADCPAEREGRAVAPIGEPSAGEAAVYRYTLTPAAIPLPAQPEPMKIAGVVVLTDEETGIAQALADQLSKRGHEVAVVRTGSETMETAAGRYAADLTSPEGVSGLLTMIRQRQGPIGGLVHLLPLKTREDFRAMDIEAWRRRLRLEVKSLFYLARGLHGDLKAAVDRGGACLIAATAMGGSFAADHSGAMDFFPGHGGVAGLVKTLAQEWSGVRVKIVDVNRDESPIVVTGNLLNEITAGDEQIEVGYLGQHRLAIEPTAAPVDRDRSPVLTIEPSWVILVSGGARGITAEVARHLAERYRPTLLLTGRSPLPDSEEMRDTAGLTAPQEIKAALMHRMRSEGQPVTPAKVEAAYMRLLHEREIRQNLVAMERTGSRVHYFSADVRDEGAFGGLIDRIYQRFGRIDGVIHGAGLIEDRLVKDKLPDSFDRVFDTKVDGAFILSRSLRPDSLKFLVFFTSVAGRFGNRGQGDYAAANEVLNKLAVYLDGRWPGRVVSVNWGPWAKLGMVSPELEREFARRGIELISPVAGCQGLDQELSCGSKGEGEVLLTGGGWVTSQETRRPCRNAALPMLPMLDDVTPLRGANGSLEVVLTLDPSRDPYLGDHQLNGKPVLPMAIAVELMAEAASLAHPDFQFVGLRGLQVLQGIILENGPRTIRIVVKPPISSCHGQAEVEVVIGSMEDALRPHYRAVAELAHRLPQPALDRIPVPVEPDAFPLTLEEAYRQWLFQGPVFRGVTAVHAAGRDGIAGSLRSSSPDQLLAGDPEGRWLVDPVVIDSGLQLVILWTRMHRDRIPLPSGFKTYRRFGPLSAPHIDCRIRIRDGSGAHTISADLCFVGKDGTVLGVLEEVEFACTRSLIQAPEGLAS